jgi:YaiO family outer membrane protein
LRPWGVSVGYGYDWFNDDRAAWREYAASIRRATPIGALILRGARAERFGLQDDQFEIEMYPRLRNGTYLYVSFALAPDHVLFPEHRYAADVYQALGGGFEGAVGFRRLQFDSPTDIYVGTLNKYLGDWLLTGRMFYIPDRAGESSKSYHGSFRRYFGSDGTSYIGGRYSRGFAREEIRNVSDFEVLQSDTLAADLNTTLGRRVTVGASFTRSNQQRVERADLRQSSATVTVGLRF